MRRKVRIPMDEPQDSLFPAFAAFAAEHSLVDKSRGNLSAKLPRILGQGTTRAVGLDCPPAPVERMMELVGLSLPGAIQLPPAVSAEMEDAQRRLEALKTELAREDGYRRFVTQCLDKIEAPSGYKDGKYFAGRLILGADKGRLEWSWSVTPHYAVIEKIPPDPDYVVRGFAAAVSKLSSLTLPMQVFEAKLKLAWEMARHFSDTDDILVTDVMRLFQIAGQDARFWQAPRRQFYKDLPEAFFVINLIRWRAESSDAARDFEFVPATLHDPTGAHPKVFFLPMNEAGTDVRPMKYLRRRTGQTARGDARRER